MVRKKLSFQLKQKCNSKRKIIGPANTSFFCLFITWNSGEYYFLYCWQKWSDNSRLNWAVTGDWRLLHQWTLLCSSTHPYSPCITKLLKPSIPNIELGHKTSLSGKVAASEKKDRLLTWDHGPEGQDPWSFSLSRQCLHTMTRASWQNPSTSRSYRVLPFYKQKEWWSTERWLHAPRDSCKWNR